ncbi:hypothetical protein ACIPPM_18960 [Streptomyces sp. NPDC090119]|uniref:hypothetical protein n=1 Tax=Streptomyces sp. NPDC090119 TaxID=3365951 RepID=UPI00381CDF38
MPESRRPVAESVRAAVPQAERVLAWLAAGEDIERTLRVPLGGLPSARDERLAHMAEVLRATAQGLGPSAAAVWAGVPEHLLRQWLEKDREFAAAVRAASSLASAHGVEPGARTPAAIRTVVLALRNGASWEAAATMAGLSDHKLRQLWRASPMLVALMEAARRARPRRTRTNGTVEHRPRTSGNGSGYRLVRRDDA